MTATNDLLKRIAFAVLGVSLIAYGLWLQSGEPPVATGARSATNKTSATAAQPPLVKVPIKDMRVGTRVPAFNPEVSATERSGFREPNWHQWMKLRLEMPKPDGTLLEIEMLRSEEWLIQQMALVVQSQPAPWLRDWVLPTEEAASAIDANTKDNKSGGGQSTTESAFATSVGSAAPLRPIYYHLAELFYAAELDGNEVLGLVVDLDLPELGISGPAWVVDLEPAPIVPAGPGQVVTATFKHASANVLDLVLTSTPPTTQTSSRSTQPPSRFTAPPSPSALSASSSTLSASPSALSTPPTDTIGVTANHPFWSVDRAEFVQAGELQIGERLQTLAGDTVWVQQKLPRPGPEPVYNLEVHDEHVYYVGTSGVLAHNNYARMTIAEAIEKGVIAIVGKARAGAAKPPLHHLFAQRLMGTKKQTKAWFSRRGVDIDRITVRLTQGVHEAIHKWVGSAGWNHVLRGRLLRMENELNRKLTAREIWEQGYRLLREAGIRNSVFEHY